MKLTSALQSVLLVGTLFTGLHAEQTNPTISSDMHNIDMDIFSLIKDELESTRKILQDIKNSHNPALLKAAASSLGGVIKELFYIAGALTIGGSAALGIGKILEIDINSSASQTVMLFAIPPLLIGVIISYAALKILFGKLLASSEKDAHHIKESLAEIGQTINKLNYEIKKLERLMQSAKNLYLA